MLQYGTVEPYTLDVLKKLMALEVLKDFYLVGGTALSLYYGHRLSIDLDLFSTVEFDVEDIKSAVSENFEGFVYNNVPNPVGLFAFIDNIKVDFVKYHYHHQIDKAVCEDGIRLMSIPDICAMKIAAILKRGVKKNFWDIAELLHHYTVEELIVFYNNKFPNHQLLISIPTALT